MAYPRYSIFDSGKFEQKDSGLFVPALSKKPEPRRANVSRKDMTDSVRYQIQLMYAELCGKLYACEFLEDQEEKLEDHRALYGWNFFTQEGLVRTAELALKLLYFIHVGKRQGKGHDLSVLWLKLPKRAKEEVNAERLAFPGGENGVSLQDYDDEKFRLSRYSHEKLEAGETVSFAHRQLYLDILSVASVTGGLIGEIKVWPWSGIMEKDLQGYKVVPVNEDVFDVYIDDAIEPFDWEGAIIKTDPSNGKYYWTLYWFYADKYGEKCSFKIPALAVCDWTSAELTQDTIEGCLQQIHQARQNPGIVMLKAIEAAKAAK